MLSKQLLVRLPNLALKRGDSRILFQSTMANVEIEGLANEPAGPTMITQVPGPKSLDMIKELDTIQV